MWREEVPVITGPWLTWKHRTRLPGTFWYEDISVDDRLCVYMHLWYPLRFEILSCAELCPGDKPWIVLLPKPRPASERHPACAGGHNGQCHHSLLSAAHISTPLVFHESAVWFLPQRHASELACELFRWDWPRRQYWWGTPSLWTSPAFHFLFPGIDVKSSVEVVNPEYWYWSGASCPWAQPRLSISWTDRTWLSYTKHPKGVAEMNGDPVCDVSVRWQS